MRLTTASVVAALGLMMAPMTLPSAQLAWAQDAAAPAAKTVAPGSLTPDQVKADQAVWKSADCASCHGWSGNGKDTGPIPPGPSLRETQLEYTDIRETIACGRPGTSMPSHDRLAWSVHACYGMKAADVGHQKPQKGIALTDDKIDAIAEYVAGYLKGRGPTSKAECEAYYSPGDAKCSSYP
ncbi:MAG TPA: c-type cytochrome [Devosia sp.]|nr:c-type cytochrome [Devosia sp.]